MQKRTRVVAGSLMMAAVTLSSVGGCEGGGGGLGGLLGGQSAQQMALQALTPQLKEMAGSYLGGLGDLSKLLAGIQNPQQAFAALTKLQPLVSQVSSASSGLNALGGVDKKNVLTAFGPELSSANSGFTSQLSRITGDKGTAGLGGLSSILSSAGLDKISLFK